MSTTVKTTDSLLCVAELVNHHHYHPYISDYEDDVIDQTHKDKLYPGAVKLKDGLWEVWTGFDWQFMELEDKKSYDIMTSPRLLDVVLWAEEKMIEEQKLDKLCEEYPALKDAKEHFDTIKSLVSEGETI